jgi:hypothetical protein
MSLQYSKPRGRIIEHGIYVYIAENDQSYSSWAEVKL